MTFYYRADGKVFLQSDFGGDSSREFVSDFARTLVERLEQRKERHGWKAGASEDPNDIYQKRQTWGRQTEAASQIAVPTFMALARSPAPGGIVYALNMSGSAGVFAWDASARAEKRFFHREALQISGITSHVATGEIVYSAQHADGTINLELIDAAGRRRGAITSGESHDLAPCFDQRAQNVIVFQSAGVARTREGHYAGIGPFALQRLDYAKGAIETIIEDARYDYLSPAVMSDGSILAIRRPHHQERGASLGQIAKDIALAPYRLGLAVIGFLNAFTMMFGRERLQSAGAPGRRDGREQRGVWLQGRWIALKETDTSKGGDAPKGLVPDSWVLVRIAADGSGETELANGFASVAVGPDDALYASDGRSVWRLSGDLTASDATMKREMLFSAPLIEEFVVVANANPAP